MYGNWKRSVAMRRATRPSAVAAIHLWDMPAPAPCASTRQARGRSGACHRPETDRPSVRPILTASIVILRAWRLPGPLAFPAGLEEKPDPKFGFIDPILQQARGSYVAVLIAKRVCLPHRSREALVVVAQFGQHVRGRNEIGVIVSDPL